MQPTQGDSDSENEQALSAQFLVPPKSEQAKRWDANVELLRGKTWSEVAADFENEMAVVRAQEKDVSPPPPRRGPQGHALPREDKRGR